MMACGVVLLMLGATQLAGAGLRVDLNVAGTRDGFRGGGREPWAWEGDASAGAAEFGGVTIEFHAAGGGRITGVCWKGLLDFGARLGADGIAPAEGSGDGSLTMVITGLAAGQHSLATFHNEPREGEPTPFDITSDGGGVLVAVTPTYRAPGDHLIASTYLEFTAVAGEPVRLRFAPHGRGGRSGVILNGFELDCPDPRLMTRMPSPADGERHAPPNALLSWTPPPDAERHHVYFGTDAAAVERATPRSPEFMGERSPGGFATASLPGIDPRAGYSWRVDAVDGGGLITRGEVWGFAVRQLAFPSAEGYGRFARGGRGGRVIPVTNLNDAGPGSLREAVDADGPRTVVFAVSGLITLRSKLTIRNPFITIAGQTAPGKGVCIRNYNLGALGAEDVIIRYLRVRPGDTSGDTLDGMGLASSDHCIIDHCSISWSLDEAFSSRGARNITLQRTLISEALNAAGHRKYPPGTQHGYAASIGGDIGSFHHNLLAHCAGRNWSLAGGLDNRGSYQGRLDIRNNVVYNWRSRATDGGAHEVNFVANYYKPGPSTTSFHALNAQYGGFPGSQRYYFSGNIMPGHFGTADQHVGRRASTENGGKLPDHYSPWADRAFFDPHVITQGAEEAYRDVLADVGCNFPELDAHDRRMISEVRDGTARYTGGRTGLAGLPDSQEDVGGWDRYPEAIRPEGWDRDGDGMPDAWELRAGLDPEAADGNRDRDADGYTNLEEYLGWLVGEFPDPDRRRARAGAEP